MRAVVKTVAAAGLALGLTAGPAAALTQDDLDGMVQALHVRNQRVDPKIWALDYSGKQLPSFTLNIGLSEDGGTVILLVKLAKKGEFTSDLDFFHQLNDLNDYYDGCPRGGGRKRQPVRAHGDGGEIRRPG
jgi:hypothetical protein